MKKILLLLLVSIFFSCKKSGPTFCWNCTLAKLNSSMSLDYINGTKSTVCNKSEEDIEKYKEDYKLYSKNGATSLLIQNMICSKQQ